LCDTSEKGAKETDFATINASIEIALGSSARLGFMARAALFTAKAPR
jgi:hypothetical protein